MNISEILGHRRSSSDKGPKGGESSSNDVSNETATPEQSLPPEDISELQNYLSRSSKNFQLPFFGSTSTPINSAGGIFSGHRRRSSASGGLGISQAKAPSTADASNPTASTSTSSAGNSLLTKVITVSKRRSLKGSHGARTEADAATSVSRNSLKLPSNTSKTVTPLPSPTEEQPSVQSDSGFKSTPSGIYRPVMIESAEGSPLQTATIAARRRDDSTIPARSYSSLPPHMQLSYFAKQSSSAPTAQQHSFLLDEHDLQQMEQGLLHLLNDFNSGKLRAFVASDTLEKMKNVREQQDRLARMHFELYAEEERLGVQSDEARNLADVNLAKLTNGLKELNQAIRSLCCEEVGSSATGSHEL